MDKRWTNSDSEIKTWTGGLGIGKVFLKDKENGYEVLGKDKEETAYIFDTNTGNFHFLPVLKTDEIVADLQDYLDTAMDVINQIKKKLPPENYTVCPERTGRLNTGLPQDYEKWQIDNAFFKYVQIEKNGRYFTINFMRWYVKKENKTINCIMGGIQFDSTATKNQSVNSQGSIGYPNTDEAQELENLEPKNEVYVYNPRVKDIWKVADNGANQLVEEFMNFIDKVNKAENA